MQQIETITVLVLLFSAVCNVLAAIWYEEMVNGGFKLTEFEQFACLLLLFTSGMLAFCALSRVLGLDPNGWANSILGLLTGFFTFLGVKFPTSK